MHSPILGEMTIAPRKFPLNLYCAFNGFDWAVKGSKHTIACRVHHVASMARDVLGEDLTVLGERVDGSAFVLPHQKGVASHISGENGCESSRLTGLVHAIAPHLQEGDMIQPGTYTPFGAMSGLNVRRGT
jgi:hypothetical protein